MAKIGKNEIVYNSVWRFLERIIAQMVTLIVSIVLARILVPDDYGAVSVIMIFINFCNILVTHGFNSSLIQKKDADKIDFSTAFFANLFITAVLFIVLFFSSPLIATYFDIPIVSPLLRVMALRIPFTAINSVQSAYVSRNLQFKKYFVATIVGTLVSGAIGIVMAYNDFGAWALVGQYLSSTIINTVVLWFVVKWRPCMCFSLQRAKIMLSYSSKILLSSLLDEVNLELSSFAIGKKYSSADLAYYNRGKQFPQIINTNVNDTITGIMFPVLSREQSDCQLVKLHMRKVLKASAFIMFPLLLGMAAVSREFLLILLTDKWIEAVSYMQIFCISCLFRPINSLNIQAVKAMGYSGKYLKTTFIKTICSITVILCLLPFGVIWVAVAGIINSLVATFIQSLPLKKIISYSFFQEIRDLFPTFMLSAVMAVIVYCVEFLKLPLMISLIVKIVVGVIFYVVLAKICKFESFDYLINILLKKKRKNR